MAIIFIISVGLVIVFSVVYNIHIDAKLKQEYLANRAKHKTYWESKGIPYIVQNIYE
jgi:hypothetical protein